MTWFSKKWNCAADIGKHENAGILTWWRMVEFSWDLSQTH